MFTLFKVADSNDCKLGAPLFLSRPSSAQFEAARAIRALPDPVRAHVPIVALTASTLQEDIDRCLAAGMDAHVSKPFDAAALAACVRQWAAPVDRDVEGDAASSAAASAVLGRGPSSSRTVSSVYPTGSDAGGSVSYRGLALSARTRTNASSSDRTVIAAAALPRCPSQAQAALVADAGRGFHDIPRSYREAAATVAPHPAAAATAPNPLALPAAAAADGLSYSDCDEIQPSLRTRLIGQPDPASTVAGTVAVATVSGSAGSTDISTDTPIDRVLPPMSRSWADF